MAPHSRVGVQCRRSVACLHDGQQGTCRSPDPEKTHGIPIKIECVGRSLPSPFPNSAGSVKTAEWPRKPVFLQPCGLTATGCYRLRFVAFTRSTGDAVFPISGHCAGKRRRHCLPTKPSQPHRLCPGSVRGAVSGFRNRCFRLCFRAVSPERLASM